MAPRRITPHLVSTEVSTAGQTPQLQQATITSPRPVQSVTLSLKDQAGEAAKVLGPGRHIYVELALENTEVDWQKLLRQQGVHPEKKAKDYQQQLAGALPAMSGADPIFKQDNPKRGTGQSVLSRVIHKLEQQFVINGQDDSEDEEEDAAEKGSEEAIADTDDDDAGKEEDQGGFNDLYDMDDDFIDDDELQDYYGGDRRKTKYSGFFINKGEIEKTDEEIATAPESPPKRRRRAKKAEDSAAKPGEPAPKKGKRARSDEAEDADQAAEKPKKSKKPKKDQPGPEAAPAAALAEAQAAQAPGSSAPAGSALPSLSGAGEAARTLAGASEADAAAASATQAESAPKGTSEAEKLFGAEIAQPPMRQKKVARKSGGGAWPDLPSGAEREPNGLGGIPEEAPPGALPPGAAQPVTQAPAKDDEAAARKDGAQDSELNKEVLASIEKLKRAAEKYRAPAAEAGAAKQIPSELKAPIKAFSLAVMRQNEKSKTALDSALDAIMPAMDQLASRRDFQVRIKADWHKVNVAADRAMKELKAEVDRCLRQGSQPAAVEDDFVAPQGEAKLPGWTWDEHRKTLLWEALTKLQQVKGGPLTPGRGVRIFAKVAEIFPAGRYSKDDLRNVYNKMKEARAARPKAVKQGSVPPQAEPSQHSSELLSSHPSTPFCSAPHSSQSRPNSAAVRPSSAASQEQALTQLAGTPAGLPPVRTHAPAAQQPSQPAPAAACAPPASTAIAVPAQAPPQPAVTGPAPASAAPTGGAGAAQQQSGLNGTSQPEINASQPAGSLQGVHTQLSDKEYAARMEMAMDAAAAHGAERAVLQTAVTTFKRGSLKAILNEVLMQTGPEGLTVAELIEKANSLGLAEPAWEPTTSKKSHLSTILNNEPLAFAHIGKYKYAHIAHKGVVHIPHMRGSRKAEPSQRHMPLQQDRATAGATAAAAAGASSQPLQQLPSSSNSLGGAMPSVTAPLQQPLAGAPQQAGMAPPSRVLPSNFGPFVQGVPSGSVAHQNADAAAAAGGSAPPHAGPAAPVTQ